MFTVREAATILAALLFWQEENVPRGRVVMSPYLRAAGYDRITPLNQAELVRLSKRLKSFLRSLDA